MQSGLKLAFEFEIAPNETKDLILDFDVCRQIVQDIRGVSLVLTDASAPASFELQAVLEGADTPVRRVSLISTDTSAAVTRI